VAAKRTPKTKGKRAAGRPAVAIVSLGCVKNLVDSEKMLGLLAEAGFLCGATPTEADLILVNTCGFLTAARDEARDAIREAVDVKRRTGGKLVVAGCMVQHAPEAVAAIDGVDATIDLGARDRIADVCQAILKPHTCGVRNAKTEGLRGASQGGRRGAFPEEFRGPQVRGFSEPYTRLPDDSGRLLLTPPHVAYLRITEGCDNRCAYCTIPAIRGPLRSKPADVILEEADGLLAGGAVELILIGQDTTAWGTDLFGRPSLERLLDPLVERIGPDRWLRVLYTHPQHWTAAVIDRFAAGPPLLGYVDLPIQHIDAGILRRMNRPAGPDRIERLIETLRARVSRLALRSTVIVGLPAETDAAFGRLLAFVQRVRFEHLGAFAYSAEPGTAAAAMPAQVPDAVKAERLEALMAAQQEIAFARNRRRVDERETGRLLADGRDSEGHWRGRFAHQGPDVDGVSYLTTPARAAGRLVEATVVGMDGYDLVAEPKGARKS
jgi:ribosomal protein S12 methylthiotransferase